MQMAGKDDSDANFSNESLQMIFEGTDAKIDDEEILGKKKYLTTKGTPLALLHNLQQKWHEGGDKIKNSKCWESRDPVSCRQIWHYEVTIEELGMVVQAEDWSK